MSMLATTSPGTCTPGLMAMSTREPPRVRWTPVTEPTSTPFNSTLKWAYRPAASGKSAETFVGDCRGLPRRSTTP